LIGALSNAGLRAQGIGNNAIRVRVDRADIDGFIDILSEELKGPERGFAKILTTSGASPGPEEFGRIISVDAFVNRYHSGWIVESIENDRYESWFQPIVTAKDPNAAIPFAREALFRMTDAKGQIVPPGRVFGIAGKSDLLFTLDLVARRSAVEGAARAKIKSKVFINFNPSAIYDPAYCLRTTAAAIRDLGMQPSDIVFELTETHRARDEEHLKGILKFYRSAGFGVALDDIGSGWSGLNMLHEYKPDYVKIDMDLIRDVDTDRFKQTIVTHLVSIAKELGITTIGEGVETESEAAWVREAGVDLLQGYYFGKPQPLVNVVDQEESESIRKATERFTDRAAEIAM
jgi:EAL domain-containing protein (putative c-di-GMP-specific phosphodiesterase class I)